MWLLSFLPAAFLLTIINIVLIVGLLGTIIFIIFDDKLPVISTKLCLAGCVLVFAVGGYLKGGYSAELAWRDKINELSLRVVEAESKSEAATTIIEERVVVQLKEVKVKGDSIVKYVDREVVKYDKTCPVPKEVIKAHNAAALNILVEDLK